MQDTEMQHMSPEFLQCWKAAKIHLSRRAKGSINCWIRAHPHPPVLEHLSFRLGNQLFFVRIVNDDCEVEGPGSMEGLFHVAEACQGHACLMPMKKDSDNGKWVADVPGWGLVDPRTRRPITPIDLVTREKIEMTRWELHDFAVQIVRNKLADDGCKVVSWEANPDVDPAIWFRNEYRKPQWVVVRATRHPEKEFTGPANWRELGESCARAGLFGHLAHVAFASVDASLNPGSASGALLYRGCELAVMYDGLQRVIYPE